MVAGEDSGCGVPGVEAGLAEDGTLAARIPPCTGQLRVGSVPVRKGTVATRGHADVARPPVVGSIFAIVMPGGGGPKPT